MTIPGELGPLPTWLVPATADTWVVAIHGHDATRLRCLRPLAAIHALDVPTLVISWRNDGDAPDSPDRR